MSKGNEIRAMRRLAGISQSELGSRAGVTQSTIAHIESGRDNPSPDTAQKIETYLRETLATRTAELSRDATVRRSLEEIAETGAP